MLSKTLQDGLHDYAIGAKIRALRLKKKIGLVELGKHTGLSPALLSKIERGRLFPDAADAAARRAGLRRRPRVLLRGAREKPVVAVVRKTERVTAARAPGRAARGLSVRVARLPGDRAPVQLLLCGVLSGGAGQLRPHEHPGVEFIYAIAGTLSVHVGRRRARADAGDSMYFDSSVPHAYRRSGGRTCSAVVVTAR